MNDIATDLLTRATLLVNRGIRFCSGIIWR